MVFKKKSLFCTFFLVLINIATLSAQPTPPPPPGEPVPISGLEFLLTSGALLGAAKLLPGKFKKQN
jgi:hypothetical protein